MSRHEKLLSNVRNNPSDVRYEDLENLCTAYFGPARQRGGSHAVFRTPWAGDPRVNIQADGNGRAKTYQVRQVLAAIDRLLREEVSGERKGEDEGKEEEKGGGKGESKGERRKNEKERKNRR